MDRTLAAPRPTMRKSRAGHLPPLSGINRANFSAGDVIAAGMAAFKPGRYARRSLTKERFFADYIPGARLA